MYIGIILSILAFINYIIKEESVLNIIIPIIGMTVLIFYFILKISIDDIKFPLLNAGFFYIFAIFIYGVSPLVMYYLGDMELSVLSHSRLLNSNASLKDFSYVGWLHIIYMTFFSIVFIGNNKPYYKREIINYQISRKLIILILILLILIKLYIVLLKFYLGIDFSAPYDASLYEHADSYNNLSTLGKQLVAHIHGIFVVLKIFIITWLVTQWHKFSYRLVLLFIVVYLVIEYAIFPGGRFSLLSIIITMLLAYHEVVKPIKIWALSFCGTVLMGAFFFANIYRGYDSDETGHFFKTLEYLGSGNINFFSISNEFQISYGSIIELMKEMESGVLEPVPLQVYLHDLLLLIPQQLLPFEKVDPVLWYLKATDNLTYFNYGVICQSILGAGIIEIIFRGLLMGYVLSSINNYFKRNSSNFIVLVFYIWFCIIVYQSFRNTSFSFLPLVFYHWGPIFLVLYLFFSKSLTKKKSF